MSQTAPLAFHPLTFVTERDGVLVGRPDTESYAMLPADGAQLLRQLADGMPVAEAASWYQATYAEPVDMADFLTALRGLGFVREHGDDTAAPRPVRYQRLGALAFSPLLWICYVAIVSACGVAMARNQQLLPRPGNVLFVRSLIVVQLVIFFAQVPGTAFHEWFHVLAGRRLGLPTRLTVSRRLYFLVFETHLDGLLSLPRRRRYLPFMSGLVADGLTFSVLTLVAAAGQAGALLVIGRLALAVAYLTLLRMAWQFCVFLRTDTYYVLTTALGCSNLAEAATAYLRDLVSRRQARPWRDGAATGFSARDRALAPWFALVTVVGTIAAFALAGVAVLPAVVEFAIRLGSGLSSGTLSGRFWDSAGSLAITVTQFAVLPLVAGRRRRIRTETTLNQKGAHA